MSNGTPCSSQLIWCETKVEKLEQQLIEWKELARNIDSQLRTELAAAQAREKILRGQLESLILWASRVTVSGCTPMEIMYATAALNQPSDDTSLRAALKAERARCAVASWIHFMDYCKRRKFAPAAVEEAGIRFR